jgi:hypothetical protein
MYLIFDMFFRGASAPTNFYLALCTAANVPSATSNTLSDLTEITAGNGYSAGGFQLSRNTTDFPTLNETDASDVVQLLIKTISWTASGGSIPASGNPARYIVLTTDEATVANRQILFAWDLGATYIATVGQVLTISALDIRSTLPSGFTNRGLKRLFDSYFRNQNTPTNFYLSLHSSAAGPGVTGTPTSSSNNLGDLYEVPAGAGYQSGGTIVNRNNTDFPTLTEDDVGNKGAIIQKTWRWVAQGATFPAAGTAARWSVLATDEAQRTSRDMVAFWDLVSDRFISSNGTIQLLAQEMRGLN